MALATCYSAGVLLQGCLKRYFASAEISHPSLKMIGGFTSLQNAMLQKMSFLPFCITPFFLFQPMTSSLHQMKTQQRCRRVLRLFTDAFSVGCREQRRDVRPLSITGSFPKKWKRPGLSVLV